MYVEEKIGKRDASGWNSGLYSDNDVFVAAPEHVI